MSCSEKRVVNFSWCEFQNVLHKLGYPGGHTPSSHGITSCIIDGISVLEHGDGLPFDDGFLLIVSRDRTVKLAMNGIRQEHVNHVVEVNEWSLINGLLTSKR